jgi:hypothetical protein
MTPKRIEVIRRNCVSNFDESKIKILNRNHTNASDDSFFDKHFLKPIKEPIVIQIKENPLQMSYRSRQNKLSVQRYPYGTAV